MFSRINHNVAAIATLALASLVPPSAEAVQQPGRNKDNAPAAAKSTTLDSLSPEQQTTLKEAEKRIAFELLKSKVDNHLSLYDETSEGSQAISDALVSRIKTWTKGVENWEHTGDVLSGTCGPVEFLINLKQHRAVEKINGSIAYSISAHDPKCSVWNPGNLRPWKEIKEEAVKAAEESQRLTDQYLSKGAVNALVAAAKKANAERVVPVELLKKRWPNFAVIGEDKERAMKFVVTLEKGLDEHQELTPTFKRNVLSAAAHILGTNLREIHARQNATAQK